MIERLVKLHDEGLIEAHVYSRGRTRACAKNAAYRKANRDKLRRYLLEYVSASR